MPRLYLPPSSAATGISPTPSTEWDDTGSVARVIPSLTRTNIAFATQQVVNATATSNLDVLFKQYVYPLAFGTVFATTDTIKGRVLAFEASAANNLRSQVIVRVIGSDGSTVRATLYVGDLTTATGNPTSEWNTSQRNIQMPRGTTVAVAANYTTTVGDYLVIEQGYRKHAAASTTGNLRYGDTNSTELAEEETTTADNTTWIEFSTTFPTVAATDATGDTICSVDAFSGTTGNTLEVYNASWTPIDAARTAAITAGGRARGNVSTATAYQWDTLPTSADYDVRGDIVVRSTLGTDAYMALAARQVASVASSTYDGYSAGFYTSVNTWRLVRWDNAVATVLGSYAMTATVDLAYPAELRCRDASKKLYIGGGERISSTDNTYTSAGVAGFITYGGGSTPGDSTGIHLDNFAAEDVLTVASPPAYTDWTPSLLTVAAWYKPHELAGLVDGDPVSTLPDQSGNGRNLTASTTLRPLYKKQIQNNRGVVRLDGINDKMTASVAASTFPASFYWTGVFRKTGSAATFEAAPLLRTASNLGRGYDRYNNTLFTGVGESSTTTTSIASMTSWTLLSSGSSPTTRQEWRNGTSELNFSGSTSYTDSATLFQLGERDDNATIFTGDVGEIVVFPSAPSTADRQLVEGYLAWTWDLVSSLDAGHPYKSAPPAIPSTPKSASDSRTLSITDSVDVAAAATSADTRALSITDSAAFTYPLSAGADSRLLTSVDTATIAVPVAASDTQSLILTDSAAIAAAYTDADTRSLTSVDTAILAAANTLADTQTLTSLDTAAAVVEGLAKQSDDTATLSIADTASGSAASTDDDTATLSITDSTTFTYPLSAGADSRVLSVVDSAVVSRPVQADDTQTLTATDSVSLAVAISATADTRTLVATDTAAPASAISATADTRALTSTDTATLAMTTTDTRVLTLADTAAIGLALADTRVLTAVETASLGLIAADTRVFVLSDTATIVAVAVGHRRRMIVRIG